MKRVLVTGMAGTGKSSLLLELAARGYRTVDTDYGGYFQTIDGEILWREDRVSMLLSSAPDELPGALFVQGTADRVVAPATATSLYNQAKPPKALLTIAGGTHGSPYNGNQLTPQVDVVSRVSIGFLDRYLEGLPDGIARMRQAVSSSNGHATLQESGLAG